MSEFVFSTPEAEGVPSKALLHFLNILDKMEYLHGLAVFRHGKMILQGSWKPYDLHTPHHLFSLSKSFVSCAVGFAIQEGRLKLTDTLGELFPEFAASPAVSAEAKAVTIRNLLTMRGGQQTCHLGEFLFHDDSTRSFVQRFLEVPLYTKGGEAFVYNSGNTFMLSAAIQKRTGQNLVEYLQPRLFAPLGIRNPYWQQSPEGIKLGGWGFFLSFKDLASFTKLLADGGKWEGRQLLPEDYLREATSFQSDNSTNTNRDWENGYGYQFWQCSHKGAFRGDGACGQYALVVPDYDMAFTTQAGLSEMGRILAAVWDELLPAIPKEDRPLTPIPADQQALAEKLASLELPKPRGAWNTTLSGGLYDLAENPCHFETLECQFQSAGGQIILTRAGQKYALPFSYGAWSRGRADSLYGLHGDLGGEIALSGAWETPDTLCLHMAFLNEPTFAKIHLSFQGDSVAIQREFQLWFLYGPDDLKASCTGKLRK